MTALSWAPATVRDALGRARFGERRALRISVGEMAWVAEGRRGTTDGGIGTVFCLGHRSLPTAGVDRHLALMLAEERIESSASEARANIHAEIYALAAGLGLSEWGRLAGQPCAFVASAFGLPALITVARVDSPLGLRHPQVTA